MKIHLDDERPTLDGWQNCRWPEEVIELLKAGGVTHLSLDHDLGDDTHGTGYDVVLWIEEQVSTTDFEPPEIVVHSANVSARAKMEAGIRSIATILKQRRSLRLYQRSPRFSLSFPVVLQRYRLDLAKAQRIASIDHSLQCEQLFLDLGCQ